jgi:hypothetical protein
VAKRSTLNEFSEKSTLLKISTCESQKKSSFREQMFVLRISEFFRRTNVFEPELFKVPDSGFLFQEFGLERLLEYFF